MRSFHFQLFINYKHVNKDRLIVKYTTCSICGITTVNGNFTRHFKNCNRLKESTSEIIDCYVNKKYTIDKLQVNYGFQFYEIRNLLKQNNIVIRTIGEGKVINSKINPYKHTKENKILMSEKRKKFLSSNPDKHPWKNKNKNKSSPCEVVKNRLRNEGINFIEEYSPNVDGRHYSIDIAFPDKKIGIEINGNQHYNNDKTLKPYYQKRHDDIVSDGWTLFEYHYLCAYNKVFMDDLVDKLKKEEIGNMEETYYIKYKKEKKVFLCIEGCGSNVYETGNRCLSCCRKNRRKVNRPSHTELLKDFNSMSVCSIGRKYGVSDNAIRRWFKFYKMEFKKYKEVDESKLTELVNSGYGIRNLQKEFGVTQERLKGIIKKLGLVLVNHNPPKYSDDLIQKVSDLYDQGLKRKVICDTLNISEQTASIIKRKYYKK